jgi:hypothetical protein
VRAQKATRNAEIEDIRMQEQMNKHVGVPGNVARHKIRGNIELFFVGKTSAEKFIYSEV